ncbi:MAG: DNA topoisomerase 3 [Proteobacteria bacterium]|nr:DNA topoisomerase 3 [Pseudomonadota bacterium]
MAAPSITLIIAEKPSVGRDIARVVGARTRRDGYLEGKDFWVAWCVGHLAELCEPHEYNPAWKSWSPRLLPILPDRFKVRPSRTGARQLRLLRPLMRSRDVANVVNACDSGREGELIFRFVYQLTGCDKPVRRLWISSLTAEAISRGMVRLRPGAELDPLADAARCRAEADWLVGMNATRALTGLVRRSAGRSELMSVGRVQTPTLALIVRREDEIEAFVSEPYWQVRATFDRLVGLASNARPTSDGAERYEGIWHRPGQSPKKPDPADREQGGDDRQGSPPASRLSTRQEAEAIASAVADRPGRITRVERKTTRERPPLLFDLTALQKTANRRYSMSAQRTLAAAQALYERHKAITYPRTDSRHLTSDMATELPRILAALDRTPYEKLAAAAQQRGLPRGKRMIDDAEVGEHHAIIPTGKAVDIERLGAEERRVYDLIARRFLAGFLSDAVFDKTLIETVVADHRFLSRGRVCIESGWQVAEPPVRSTSSTKRTARAGQEQLEQSLSALRRDDPVHTAAAEVCEGKTEPPRRYSEASLLASMERAGRDLDDEALRRAMKDAGLGTPATRAAIIETLLKRDYVRRQGRVLQPTQSGRALVAAIPVADLLSAELTGAWEQKLADIARGRAGRLQFMRDVRSFTTRVVEAIAGARPPDVGEAEVLGLCPVCRGEVKEGFKAYSCATGTSCSFVIYKRIAGRAISPALVRVLLARGRSQVLAGFRSRRGKRFRAALVLGDDGKVEMAFDSDRTTDQTGHTHGSAAQRSRAASGTTPSGPADGPRCPACRKGRIITGQRGWGCSRWRESCRFVVWFEHGDLRLPEDEAERLFRRGQTRLMDGLSPHGRARLVLDLEREGNVRIELGKRGRRRADQAKK